MLLVDLGQRGERLEVAVVQPDRVAEVRLRLDEPSPLEPHQPPVDPYHVLELVPRPVAEQLQRLPVVKLGGLELTLDVSLNRVALVPGPTGRIADQGGDPVGGEPA